MGQYSQVHFALTFTKASNHHRHADLPYSMQLKAVLNLIQFHQFQSTDHPKLVHYTPNAIQHFSFKAALLKDCHLQDLH